MYECDGCDKTFKFRCSLVRHLNQGHGETSKRTKLKCAHSGCVYGANFFNELRSHVKHQHNVPIEVECLTFADTEEFWTWKRKYEKETLSNYIQQSSGKVTNKGNKKKTYFICHRTGQFLSRSSGSRKLKRQGSVKMNASCTSTMEMTESLLDGTVQLVLWKTHYGHEPELIHTWLHKDEREWLEEKIADGVGFEEILDNVKQSDRIGKINLITRQDLRNFKKLVMTHTSEDKQPYDSLRSWVKDIMNFPENSPVIFFKDYNSPDPRNFLEDTDISVILLFDFQKLLLSHFDVKAICIDGTYMNDNSDIELITILTTGKDLSWAPVAYCISNKINKTVLEYFFIHLLEAVGDISCQILLTDGIDYFAEAWYSVMSIPDRTLISPWYIEKFWRDNLPNLEIDSSLRKAIFFFLKVLLTDCRKEKFEKAMHKLEVRLQHGDIDIDSFHEAYFTDKPQLWAPFYTEKHGLNIDERQLSWYKSLYRLLPKKKGEKLDGRCLNEIMKLTRKVIPEEIITEICKQNLKTKLEAINNAHKQSESIYLLDDTIHPISENMFKVRTGKTCHMVQHFEDVGACSCSLQCSECNICIHSYSCTCNDYVIRFNICCHIHACEIAFAV